MLEQENRRYADGKVLEPGVCVCVRVLRVSVWEGPHLLPAVVMWLCVGQHQSPVLDITPCVRSPAKLAAHTHQDKLPGPASGPASDLHNAMGQDNIK